MREKGEAEAQTTNEKRQEMGQVVSQLSSRIDHQQNDQWEYSYFIKSSGTFLEHQRVLINKERGQESTRVFQKKSIGKMIGSQIHLQRF